MKIKNNNGTIAAIIEKDQMVNSVQDILDIIADAVFTHQCKGVIIYKESLGEDFFNLKTGYAGEILQKFSNYHLKVAIIGDFGGYTSKSLRDFIYESNNGNRVFFKGTLEEGIAALESAGG